MMVVMYVINQDGVMTETALYPHSTAPSTLLISFSEPWPIPSYRQRLSAVHHRWGSWGYTAVLYILDLKKDSSDENVKTPCAWRCSSSFQRLLPLETRCSWQLISNTTSLRGVCTYGGSFSNSSGQNISTHVRSRHNQLPDILASSIG